MARMQRFEVSLNDTVKLLTSRAPLDSTAIYPITRSPNNHHETGKQENLSRSYLCLAHSTWARWWRPLFSSRWNTFLDCARLYLLDEDSHKLSSILNMGEPHLAHLHISITIKYMASFKNIVSSIWPSWTCTTTLSTLNITSSTLDLHYFILLFALKPTYGPQALPMDKSYKYSSMQTLVHRDCH